MRLRLYRVTRDYFGEDVLLYPQVPKNVMIGEDSITPRICTCTTIPQCLQSLELEYSDEFRYRLFNGEEIVLNLYTTVIDDINDIAQPDIDLVPDAWKTGEVWVIQPKKFNFVNKLAIRYHMDIPNSVYSRLLCRFIDEEEVLDFYAEDPIYGDYFSFSYLVKNINRVNSAIDYAQSRELEFYPNSEKKIAEWEANHKSSITK